MKPYRVLFSALLLYFFLPAHAQLTINELGENRKLEDLVHAFTGSGISIKKIKYTGHNEAVGSFEDEQGASGFTKGLVLANGRVELIAGGNTKPNTSTNFGDPFFRDKHVISKSSLCDGAVLEIDFIPAKDSIALSFVFGSEEYPEFTGKEFNDVFKVLVQPLYVKAPAKNIARLPDKSRVSVSSVNADSNSAYYIDNSNPANPYYNFIEFDGFTKVINTGARVTRGKLHRLKIIVVDLEDCDYDTGVLLDAYSFRSLSSKPKRFKPVSKKYALDPLSGATLKQRINHIADSLARFTYDSLVIGIAANDSLAKAWAAQLKLVSHTIKCSKFVWQTGGENEATTPFVSIRFTAYRKPQ